MTHDHDHAHGHGHDHEHGHSHGHDHNHTLAPSAQGTVMLNIGTGIGALIIHTPAAMHGQEIEVSPVGDPTVRKHAAVRARYVHSGVRWSEVIDELPEGRYVIWRDPVTPLDEIDVPGGSVAEFTWPAVAATA